MVVRGKGLFFLSLYLLAAVGCSHAEGLKMEPKVDIALTLCALTLGGGIEIIKDERIVAPPGALDPRILNPLDRRFAGGYNPRADHYSDWALIASALLPLALYGSGSSGVEEFAADGVVYTQALSLSLCLAQFTKTAVARPRPLLYGADRSIAVRADDYLSFFSGHTTLAFASATTLTAMALKRDMKPALTAAVAASGYSSAAVCALLRMRAGKHFPTDVIAGAIVGSALSMVVVNLHEQR
jgi:hypothetical protein